MDLYGVIRTRRCEYADIPAFYGLIFYRRRPRYLISFVITSPAEGWPSEYLFSLSLYQRPSPIAIGKTPANALWTADARTGFCFRRLTSGEKSCRIKIRTGLFRATEEVIVSLELPETITKDKDCTTDFIVDYVKIRQKADDRAGE